MSPTACRSARCSSTGWSASPTATTRASSRAACRATWPERAAMRRHRRHRQHDDANQENHDRWLVSYADFITLLFAFFVVMYSLSSVNEGKYRVLSDSIIQAFRNISVNTAGEKVIR